MTDTVFILGAGFSYDAGIPLLSGFVDKMWELAIREKNGGQPLSAADIDVFQKAMEIRKELDGYHGRANFDDRNIEDLLSILTFKLLGKRSYKMNQLAKMSSAITRTIELTCQIQHPGTNAEAIRFPDGSGSDIYRKFWEHIFTSIKAEKKPLSIISFNYDLVLERSLHQVLICTTYEKISNRLPMSNLCLNYSFSSVPLINYEINYENFRIEGKDIAGPNIKPTAINKDLSTIEIDLLKLHGSLNFPKEKITDPVNFAYGITTPLSSPLILPPVFNKMTSGRSTETMWQAAMKKLGSAKNIIIIGYSLPKTDIYMQYFLKAALGPNKNLNKVFIFDPVLFQENKSRDEMMDRYKSCFSETFIKRIVFQPNGSNVYKTHHLGTTRHFVELLENNKGNLLF